MSVPSGRRDLLAGVAWEIAATAPGAASGPGAVDAEVAGWRAATVPGTAAGALRTSGQWHWGEDDEDLLDGHDWWFRCTFAASGDGPWELRLDGLATVADVWLNGETVLHSENMFLAHRIAVPRLAAENALAIRCSALDPLLAVRRGRPRWRTKLLRAQNLRWFRTTPLGRVPGWAAWAAPVGPWRPVALETVEPASLGAHRLHARCDGEGGVVRMDVEIRRPGRAAPRAELRVGDQAAPLEVRVEGSGAVARGMLRLPSVERWWPHTHGAQPRYPVSVAIDGTAFPLGSVGFRTVALDRTGGAFSLRVNEEPVFCRGACWVGPDVVDLNPPAETVRASLERMREAGMNMVRIGGYTLYEGPAFWEACDELGLLVWQDCMLASFDPPQDDAFTAAIEAELDQVLGALGGRPALTLVCGSSETEQQAAMFGLPADRRDNPLLDERIPALVEELLPGLPYVASAPSGGDLPFHPETGVSHYFGVGAYLRPPADARLSGVRFAAECLAFGTPPEAETVEELFGGAAVAGHDAAWKRGVPRDSGASWDFEDVRDHYVRELFAVDPLLVRYAEPERALDLGRAAVAELMAGAMGEWRRSASTCAGALVLSWQDLWPGAGWGLLDCLGRPKAPWYALKRTLAPVAVVLVDEGLSGLRVHVHNDRPAPLSACLTLRAFAPNGIAVEHVERPVEVPARGELVLGTDDLLGGFRDLTWAYRFGPPSYDVLAVSLTSPDGAPLGEAVRPLLGLARHRQAEVGLEARAQPAEGGGWSLTVSTRDFAQSVAIDVPGFRAADSWFHLPPGETRTVRLTPSAPDAAPAGRVRALNAIASVPVTT